MEKLLTMIIVVVVLALVVGPLAAFLIAWLWNVALVPAVSGVHEITWLQAWGIYILSGFLFKSTNIQTNKS